MKNRTIPYVFVIGNEKGGAGKTTCSMHLIAGLLDKGYKVASIDTDSRQHSLTTYLLNRSNYNKKNPNQQVTEPLHFHIKESNENNKDLKEQAELKSFEEAYLKAQDYADYVVIDTPGKDSVVSRIAHSRADTIVTPINDSFVDFDVLAKVNVDDFSIANPSIYSQMIWEQKIQKASNGGGSIDWIVVRNRLSNLDATNKRNVSRALELLSKRISFKVATGFSERVVFRELFLHGLTLLDLPHANYDKTFSVSHISARQELKEFLKCLDID